MDEYTITFTRSARKELEALDAAIVRRIFPRIESLAKDPRPRGCLKLQGEEHLWRIRVGYYRIIYAIDAEKQKLILLLYGIEEMLTVDAALEEAHIGS